MQSIHKSKLLPLVALAALGGCNPVKDTLLNTGAFNSRTGGAIEVNLPKGALAPAMTWINDDTLVAIGSTEVNTTDSKKPTYSQYVLVFNIGANGSTLRRYETEPLALKNVQTDRIFSEGSASSMTTLLPSSESEAAVMQGRVGAFADGTICVLTRGASLHDSENLPIRGPGLNMEDRGYSLHFIKPNGGVEKGSISVDPAKTPLIVAYEINDVLGISDAGSVASITKAPDSLSYRSLPPPMLHLPIRLLVASISGFEYATSSRQTQISANRSGDGSWNIGHTNRSALDFIAQGDSIAASNPGHTRVAKFHAGEGGATISVD